MSRTAHRLFSSPLRLSTRINSIVVARSPRAVLTQRMMSSELHTSHRTSSDTPWIIGSALVFGPLFLYLVSPSARKDHHAHAAHGHKSHPDDSDKHAQHVESHRQENIIPIVDDEGTEVHGQAVKESMEMAFVVDSPKDAQELQEVVAKAETKTVEENSAIETESATDAMPVRESEPTTILSPPVDVDVTAQATGEERAQGTTALEPAAESKA